MTIKKWTKEDLIEDLIEVSKKYFLEFPHEEFVSRDYYREYGSFKDALISVHFGSYHHFKKYAQNKNEQLKRENIRITKDNHGKKGKFVVSSLISGTFPDKKSLESIQFYCKKKKAKLIILPMRGSSKKDEFPKLTYEELNEYFATNYSFNSNLKAKELQRPPTAKNPFTGLKNLGHKDYSAILASPRQELLTVSSGMNKLPHLLMTTGSISEPNYKEDQSGEIANQYHKKGGIIVEVKDDKTFFVRQIQTDENGGFNDLGEYYCNGKVKKTPPEAILIEPHFGEEDPVAMKVAEEIIRETGAKRIFFEDAFDMRSINHHEMDDSFKKAKRKPHQLTLLGEMEYIGEKLEEWSKKFPKKKIYIVPSNHDLFLYKYLTQGLHIKSEINSRFGGILYNVILEGLNPFEWFFKQNFKIPNITFLEVDKPFQIAGVELNCHGHMGMSGTRGSARSLEDRYGKSFGGHTHSPLIWHDVYKIGCSCNLDQEYTKGYGSKWLHCVGLLYNNGNIQLVISIENQWKL